MKFAICFFLLATVFAAHGNITWSICSSDSAHGKLTNVLIENNPVVPKENTTVYGYGQLNKMIVDGKWKLDGYYQGIKVFGKTGNLCQDSVVSLPMNSGMIYIQGLKCPVQPGDINVVEKALFKFAPPKGVYTIKCRMTDQDSEEILCLNINVPM